MEKSKILKKLFNNKYGNPWQVKLFIVCLLIVPLTIFCVFTVYGNFGGFIQAFQKVDNGKVVGAGWSNFETFFLTFKDERIGDVILNSLGYLFIVMFISVPISVVCSFFLYKKVPFSKAIVVMLFMPNILPLAILGVYYNNLMDTVLFDIMSKILGVPVSMATHGNLMLYIYTVYFGFGYNAVLIWGAMTRIPEEIVEAANLDGANLFVEFFNVTIPIIWPTMSMVLVLTWMVPFTVYNQPLIIHANEGANKDTATWALYVMLKVKADQFYASALSIMAALISIPTTLILQKALEKVFPVIEV